MASNHKLSGVLKGRVLAQTLYENDVCTITFDDGATMHIKIAPRVLAPSENASSAASSTPETATSSATAPQLAASSNAGSTDANAKSANAESTSSNSPRGVVKAVRQSGTELHFDLEDGTTLSLTTREETSCVMLRDKNNVLEYAD